jgi:hypothetical protein
MIRFDKRAVRCAAFDGHALDKSSAIAEKNRQLCCGAGRHKFPCVFLLQLPNARIQQLPVSPMLA